MPMQHTMWCDYPEGCNCGASEHNALELENKKLRKALEEISTFAHCVAKAGPLNTPTLQDAWAKFMKIDAMASKALNHRKSHD